MRVLHFLNNFHLNNIVEYWVSVWRWPTFLVFFSGLFILFFVVGFILYLITQKNKLFMNRHTVVSFSLGVYSLVYSIWFSVFFAVLWVGGSVVRSDGSSLFRYDVGPWIILFIVLFPLLFFSFIGNTIWFLKLIKKEPIT